MGKEPKAVPIGMLGVLLVLMGILPTLRAPGVLLVLMGTLRFAHPTIYYEFSQSDQWAFEAKRTRLKRGEVFPALIFPDSNALAP
jgi:hypothetical protein